MTTIKVMDENLANKIAAGEVIERTMNVVKELVENSIDAKSHEIKIELIDSGIKQIKITDDGIGMTREDAEVAFLRHATSKLKNLDDLFHVQSLGFRGEALPSIAAVSKVVLKTSTGDVGTLLTIDGGKIIDCINSDSKQGTSITVTNLFYNTPVRLKYMKNPYVELATITEYLHKMALSYPNIKFYFTNNGKVLLNTTGDGDLLKVIYNIYNVDVAKKMIEVDIEDNDYHVYGYIGYPELARSNRSHLTILVNGRLIRNMELNRLITDCYHTYIPKDKYPVVILNIEVDPILIDVNIHPTKMDIKFSKMTELKEFLSKIITEKLEHLTLIPSVVSDDIVSNNLENNISEDTFKKDYISNSYEQEDVSPIVKSYEDIKLDFEVNDTPVNYHEEKENRIKKMYPVGLVHGTYIIAQNDDGMFIIDQHAAAERINYEKCLKAILNKEAKIMELLVPIEIELPMQDFIIIKEHIDLLKQLQFEIEEFGSKGFLIRKHPNWLAKGREKEAILKIIDIICVEHTFDYEKFVDHTAATMACKMSVKANDYLSLKDMEYLLDTLRKCDNPFTCPHGRPTIIVYSKYQLEKLFKRAMN